MANDAKPSISTFLRQVRTETRKVTWPTRRETTVTAIVVFIMVAIAMVFFGIVDFILFEVVNLILGLETGL